MSEWLETSAKWPEGTGTKNTSQLEDLSLEFSGEEQYKLINEGVYISSPWILKVSLWSHSGINMRLMTMIGFLILRETYQKGVTLQLAARWQWTTQNSSKFEFLLSFLHNILTSCSPPLDPLNCSMILPTKLTFLLVMSSYRLVEHSHTAEMCEGHTYMRQK